jgi:hypothetical protein
MTAAHYTRGRRRRNRLGLHYSRFPPISADRLLVHQLLAGPKLENPVANRRSQASEETVEIFVEADFETHATVADLLSPAHVSWRKTLSFSILA